MRHAFVLCALLAAAGCTRNSGVVFCIPGEQKACACPGGTQGVQVCTPAGDGLGECLGCPGGPGLPDMTVIDPNADMTVNPVDLAGADLTGADLTVHPDLTYTPPDFPPGTDLFGVDLSVPPPPDLATPPPPDMTFVQPCANVMVVLDTSGSMSSFFPGSGVDRLEDAKAAINKLLASYTARLPLGLTHYDTNGSSCSMGANILVEPALNTAAAIQAAMTTLQPGGATNTGNAIAKVANDPKMFDAMRPGSFVILVTDGAGNCESGTPPDPQFTVAVIDQAAKQRGLKTFVIGLDIPSGDVAELELMAQAGQQECTSGFCKGHRYWPASSRAQLETALDLVLNKIVSSAPGGSCGAFACFSTGAQCGAGASCCGTGGCKNLASDPDNCGECGTSCGVGGTCSMSKCSCGGTTCPVADTCCGGTCCSKLDMAQPPPDFSFPPLDFATPRDLAGSDLAGLPACSCGLTCLLGCKANNCCVEDSSCAATPNLCRCTGIYCP